MLFNKHDKKSTHPYAWLAVFSLAAAGVISISRKGMSFISEKAGCIKDMVKSKTNNMMN